MLRLDNIKKNYKVADTKVEALKGVSLSFRKNEFVSILGPSGCGKTTLLNIIGGLDKYSFGDLWISGRSTKGFKDPDWDVYRNHRIGFIFQSYNLIPHQTVLGNVELALTISGISKEERTRRAKEAIDKVGLADQYSKRPNQLSGGQCQRVAIARALVNEPEILLADEPTGALDTVTSVQIMDLIKEISKDRLVIMVTHNPDIAEKYSTRIIRLLDGLVLSDSKPFSVEEEKAEMAEILAKIDPDNKPVEKAKMSFFTAFRLSLRNLLSKKGRTIMTCIAGSIGIIGVSAVLALSAGVKGYIADIQEDLLSGNPITINESTYDINALMSIGTTQDIKDSIKEDGKINVDSLIQTLLERAKDMENIMVENNITQEYLDYIAAMPAELLSSLSFGYGLDMENSLYTSFKIDANASSTNTSLTGIKSIYTSILEETEFDKYAGLITSLTDLFAEAPIDEDYILSQYDILDGKVAKEANEVMVVLDKNSAVTDLVLAQLGYYTQEEFLNIANGAVGNDHEESLIKDKFTYEEILGKEFSWYPNDSIFSKGFIPGVPFMYNPNGENLKDGVELNVVGILEPKEDIAYGCLSSGFYYTSELTKHAIQANLNSEIVTYLKDNNKTEFETTYDMTEETITDAIGFTYKYTYEGVEKTAMGYVGSSNTSLLGGLGSGSSKTKVTLSTLSSRHLGGIDMANSIAIYAKDFNTKESVIDYLKDWNSSKTITVNGVEILAENREEITYTDNLSLIIAMMNGMIDVVTIALIIFTALSLVVSCVMIGIITYVSVVERVKEIGVIRSLGGRKHDVSNLFNAETFMIGLVSGTIGVVITYILSLIINIIINALIGIPTIAALPWYQALIMIGISIILTTISGLIPSRSAAKMDPVNALRSE